VDVKTYVKAQWDRVAAWIAVLVGLLALTIGYFGASDTVFPSEQIPYIISGGMFGIFCLGVGAILWLSADLRDEWRKLDEIDDHLLAVLADRLPTESVREEPAAVTVPVTAARRRRSATQQASP
jgi:hypothetical protein